MPRRVTGPRSGTLRFCVLYAPGAAFLVWGFVRAAAGGGEAAILLPVGAVLVAASIVRTSRGSASRDPPSHDGLEGPRE